LPPDTRYLTWAKRGSEKEDWEKLPILGLSHWANRQYVLTYSLRVGLVRIQARKKQGARTLSSGRLDWTLVGEHPMPSWIIFLLSAVVIVIAGTKLSHYGDQIAELTGLGGLWVGMVLLAGATSLPELLTDISAIWLQAPDLAVGDLFGSNMANMLILGIIDLFHREQRVWQQAAYEHTLSAALAIALTGLAGIFIFCRVNVALWGVGLGSILIAIVYVFGMRVVYRQEDMRQRERERMVEAGDRDHDAILSSRMHLKGASIGFAVAAFAIVIAAPFLATSAKSIAEETGIGTTLWLPSWGFC
jgi:cation:H+ antiporter